jgi:hypothetical protein
MDEDYRGGQQVAVIRDTEGFRETAQTGEMKSVKSAETRRARGRPKGSRTIAKGILQKHVAEELLATIRPLLPQAEYDEIRLAIKNGKTISTLREVKIMMALMAPPIWKRLVDEARPKAVDSELEDEIGLEPQQAEMARDLNERVKVWKDLAVLASNLEKTLDEGTDTKPEPLWEIFKRKGLDAQRFTITGSIGPGVMGRDSSGSGGGSDNLGTISDQLPSGPFDTEDSEEIETVGLLDTDRYRDDPSGDNAEELQR